MGFIFLHAILGMLGEGYGQGIFYGNYRKLTNGSLNTILAIMILGYVKKEKNLKMTCLSCLK
jgi:hypothetical protein